MRRVEYRGPLWDGDAPHRDLLALLLSKDLLIDIVSEDAAPEVVLGVPHQSALGTPRIAEHSAKPRVGDDGAAFFAVATFASLLERGVGCRLLIAAHATDHDPNKELGGPYCRAVFARPAKLLFECHGAAGSRANEIELTAGNNRLSRPRDFGELLDRATEGRYTMAAQSAPGHDNARVFGEDGRSTHGTLALPALKTHSLVEAMKRQMHALHLETKPAFRVSWRRPEALTERGRELAASVSVAIEGYLDRHLR